MHYTHVMDILLNLYGLITIIHRPTYSSICRIILIHVLLFQQWRLFPYLTATFLLTTFADLVLKEYMDFSIAILMGEDRTKLVIL
jgi:hypothetical protein